MVLQASLSRIKPETFKEWNEKMVRKYDPDAFHHHPNPIVRFIERKRVEAIFKLMKPYKDNPVLEVGCGAGNVIEKALIGELFGVDMSSFILAKAQQKLNKRVHLFQGDALNLPCKNQVFMQVICSEVLEHLLSPLDALNEIARILKPQGVAIISVPNELWINRIKSILVQLRIFRWFMNRRGEYREMPERMEDEWHLHTLSLEEWLTLFRRYFKLTRLRRIPFLWLPLRYVVLLEKLK